MKNISLESNLSNLLFDQNHKAIMIQERILLCRILRRSAILPRGIFYFIGDFIEISYEIKKDIFISNMSSESSDEQIRTADTTGMNRML